MKVAVAGKGGVGKTTLSGSLARLLGSEGEKVFAIDADPNANLSSSIGFDEKEAATFTPLIEMKKLIEERTGAAPGTMGAMFSLTPKVDDIPEMLMKEFKGVKFLLTGAMREPSTGCYCPENALLKSLLQNMMIARNETVILDMEAGFEHLTRGTAKAFDAMIIVVEPGMRSIQTAWKISNLAEKTGIEKVFVVGNKIMDDQDKIFVREKFSSLPVIGFISSSSEILRADRLGQAPFDLSSQLVSEIKEIRDSLYSNLPPKE